MKFLCKSTRYSMVLVPWMITLDDYNYAARGPNYRNHVPVMNGIGEINRGGHYLISCND